MEIQWIPLKKIDVSQFTANVLRKTPTKAVKAFIERLENGENIPIPATKVISATNKEYYYVEVTDKTQVHILEAYVRLHCSYIPLNVTKIQTPTTHKSPRNAGLRDAVDEFMAARQAARDNDHFRRLVLDPFAPPVHPPEEELPEPVPRWEDVDDDEEPF